LVLRKNDVLSLSVQGFKNQRNFSEFADTIKDGKPEMQMKEMIKFIVSQLFKYNYFHGL
jgi:hypothetical protein